MNLFLGIDTSNYTTSCAVMDERLTLVGQERMLLPVAAGERGLRQSEAVFAHLGQLPVLLERMQATLNAGTLAAVCASVRPVDAPDSYMPVFRVGHHIGRSIAATHDIAFLETTHQRGHIAAAALSCSGLPDCFLAMHLSGGTTDLLAVQGEDVSLLGQSLDLHAGQLVDRVGVRMGLRFPAGPQLEALAQGQAATGRYGAAVQGGNCHLSGAEAQAMRDLEAGDIAPEQIAAEVFDVLARFAAKMLRDGTKTTGLRDALVFGGIASAALFRSLLQDRVSRFCPELRLSFGLPEHSGDNAAGVASICARRYLEQREV